MPQHVKCLLTGKHSFQQPHNIQSPALTSSWQGPTLEDIVTQGASGVWYGLECKLPPLVWRIKFPPEIQQEVVSQHNPQGKLTNSNLEMVGLLLQWLVLKQVVDLRHAHIACWCDNTPMVAWATKLLTTKAMTALRLIRILALHMFTCQASPLTALHILGKHNWMADFASWSFSLYPTQKIFLTEFHHCFPLPQNNSWICFCLPNATIGQVLSMLSTPTSNLVLWHRLSLHGSITGGIGSNSFPPTSINTFKTWLQQNDYWSCMFLLDGSGKANLDAASWSRPVASKLHLVPLRRPSNWLATATLSTATVPPHTMPHSPSKQKHTTEPTLSH